MGDRIMPDRQQAPVLMVIYRCPKCKGEVTLDAYNGPPRCQNNHILTFMEPIALDKRDSNPLADIEKLRSTERKY